MRFFGIDFNFPIFFTLKTRGHDDNLEFLEFSEFLNSKILSSELSLFPYTKKR